MTDTESAKTQTHSAKTGHFQRFSPNGSALWRPHPLKSRLRRRQSGGELRHARLRHADDTPLEGFAWRKIPIAASLKCAASLQDLGTAPVGAIEFAQHHPYSGISAKNFAQQVQKRRIWGVVSAQGELFRAHTHHQTKQGELFLACRRWPTSATPQPPAQRARQGLAAVPAGSGVARPRHSWAAAWPGRASRRRTEPTARGRAAAHGAARPHNAAARPQPGYATRSSPSEPCARAGASHPGRSGCGPRCAAPRLRCR